MSIINFILKDNVIIIVSDSIASIAGGKPIRYVTKVHPLPHLNSIICGTGSLELIVDWYSFILKCLTIKDIMTLDKITPESLNRIYDGYENKPSATIYQFGYLEDSICIGYAYRSNNNFKSEELKKSWFIKPAEGFENTNMDELTKNKDLVQVLVEICIKQKAIQDSLPLDKKLGIGGSVYLFVMKKNCYSINEIYMFEDKDRKFQEMLINISQIGGNTF